MTIQPKTHLDWRKSSYSGGTGGNCVEVATAARNVHLRNSKHPDDGTLTFTGSDLAAFIAGCVAGEFDDLS